MASNLVIMRIVSFSNAGAEIVKSLGLERSLTGVSSYCGLSEIPVVTRPKTSSCYGSSPIKLLECDLYLLEPDRQKLTKASPDVIITQENFKGNPVAREDIERILPELSKKPRIITLAPMNLQSVFDTIFALAKDLNVASKGESLISAMGKKLENLKKRFPASDKKKTAVFLDRVEPLMLGNYWIPELLSYVPELEFPMNSASLPSSYTSWNDILELDPDYVFIAPEFHSLHEANDVVQKLNRTSDFHSLKAFNKKQVFLFDGKKYFNAPVPTLIDSLEAVGQALYPETFGTNLIGKVWSVYY